MLSGFGQYAVVITQPDACNFGNVAQLEKAGRRLLIRLAREARLLRGAECLAFAGVDSSQKRVFGYAKQGARFGVAKIAS